MTDRRAFLKALAATGAVTMLPDAALFGQTSVTKLNVPGGPSTSTTISSRQARPRARGRGRRS